MKVLVRLVCVGAFIAAAAPITAQQPAASGDRQLPKPNYELAATWSASKVGKVIFDTAVTPHWLEFSDRFWYAFESPAGRKWWIVDPVKKTRTPLWDNAKMAVNLTRILRTPYDAQHLPIGQIKFIDNDTKVRFSVDLPNASKVVSDTGEELLGETQTQQGRQGGRGQNQTQTQDQDQQDVQQGGRGGRGAAGGPPAGQKRWWLEYELAGEKLSLNDKYEPEKPKPGWASVSPDKQTVIFARGFNLFMMDGENYKKALAKADDPSIVETQLTEDGVKDYSYARNNQGQGGDDEQNDQGGGQGRAGGQNARTTPTEQDKKFGPRAASVGISWSQDNKKFAFTRTDQRKVADLWVINALASPRPRLETYKYGMPGEENQPQEEAWAFDIASHKGVKIKTDAFKDQQMDLNPAPLSSLQREKQETESRWLTIDGSKLYFNRTSRDLKRIDIVEADTTTGDSKVIIPERSNTYIEIQPLRVIHTATGQSQLIQWSERDGWGHYYLYDTAGKLIRQITSGEFQCMEITGVDDKTRTIFFSAAGREPGEDPYYTHAYSANVDTGAIKLLTPGNATHAVTSAGSVPTMNDKHTFFVDTWSRINSAPESALFDAAGNKVMDLEKVDLSVAFAQGFKFPDPFTVKADDGITDLYGVMFKPFDFDASKKYPIVEYVYPGPQTEAVSKAFSPRDWQQTLANVGFIVIEVGNRGGNPARSKWYHNYGYGNLRDYGVPDKKAAVEQLAKLYPWIDSSRVGIWGHSGGGFMTAAAMFGYPDFFKVGVSESGNHDNSIYNRWWSEKHDGVKELPPDKDGKIKFEYDIDKNQDIAKNLKGHILFITGDVDNNVHPSNTYRVLDALIKANKRFDFILLPGQRHAYGPDADYAAWRRIDYFTQWLLGVSQDDIDMLQLQREKQIKK